jgi:hypothetical protein
VSRSDPGQPPNRPLADEELWDRVLDLDPLEMERLQRLMRERVGRDFDAAVASVLEIQGRSAKLQERPGRPRGKLGHNPEIIARRHLLIRWLYEHTLEALKAAPESGRTDPESIAARILEGLAMPYLVPEGPLRDHIYLEAEATKPEMQAAVTEAVGEGLRLGFRSATARALAITGRALELFGWDLNEDYLRRLLRRTPKPIPRPRPPRIQGRSDPPT